MVSVKNDKKNAHAVLGTGIVYFNNVYLPSFFFKFSFIASKNSSVYK